MSNVGIVGAGVSGLHLALLLQQRGLEPTLYSQSTADDLANAPLPNTVAHHHHTRSRERELGVNHWDETAPSYDRHYHFFGVEPPLAFPGSFRAPSMAVDYRIYLPRLLGDFENRGGRVVYGPLAIGDIDRLGETHDLVVVANGRGGFTELFPTVAGRSPFPGPARVLSAGIYTGIAPAGDPLGVTFAVAPGHGEVIEIPIHTFDGNQTTLLFECIPGGELEVLATTPYADDPQKYERLALEMLERHIPPIFDRADVSSFHLARPSSILQGSVTPVVRESHTRLQSGTYALAMGDVHVTVDPVVGQGANSASVSAWTIGEAILEDGPLDERFIQRVDERRLPFVLGVFDWTNLMLGPPPPHLLGLVGAMSQNRALCDDFTENFNHPDVQWEHLSSPERTEAYIASFS